MSTAQDSPHDELEREVWELESALYEARRRLHAQSAAKGGSNKTEDVSSSIQLAGSSSAKHTLLLLADSALPLGSFAFSSGLESYLAHHKSGTAFPPFLGLSIDSLASTALPYIIAAYRGSAALLDLDNDFDASTPCTVARRASIAQGRALLGVWERSLKQNGPSPSATNSSNTTSHRPAAMQPQVQRATNSLIEFSTNMKSAPPGTFGVQGHFAPLWGTVCCSQNVNLGDTAYVFLLSHAKAVTSAAVRASVLGPYAAQGLLASGWLRGSIEDALRSNWSKQVDEAGQCAPVLDLWVGRHELLYSRIFNS